MPNRVWPILLTVLIAAMGRAEERVALVIGNGRYEGTAALKNPVNDANAIATALTKLDFKVTRKTDVDLTTMEDAVLSFSRSLTKDTIAVFFYAGHGIQAKGDNYLVPLKADIREEFQVKTKCYKVEQVLDAMEDSNAALKIIILDCCRDNPFTRSFTRSSGGQGLAGMSQVPDGTLIAFSTAPGRTALDGRDGNSPYTKHLVAGLSNRPKGGLELTEVFRDASRGVKRETGQVPWLNLEASLEKFYLWQGEAEPTVDPKSKQEFDVALQLYHNADFAGAEAACAKFLLKHRGHDLSGQTLACLGDCLLQQQKHAAAEPQLAAALTHELPPELRARTLLRLGNCRLELALQDTDNLRKAIDTYAELLQAFPSESFLDEVLHNQMSAYFQLAEYTDVVRVAELLLKRYPGSSYAGEAKFRRAESLYFNGGYQEALSAFADYLQAPERKRIEEARVRHAECKFELGDFAGAQSAFLRASKLQNFELADLAYLRYADCLARGGNRNAEAGELLEAMRSAYPVSALTDGAELSAGRYFEQARRDTDALRMFKKVLDLGNDDYAEAAYWTSVIFARQKKPGESAVLAAEALTRNPDSVFAGKLKAVWADGLFDVGRQAEALTLYARVVENHRDDEVAAGAAYRCIYICRQLKKYPDAVKYANQFVERFPDHESLENAQLLLEECKRLGGLN